MKDETKKIQIYKIYLYVGKNGIFASTNLLKTKKPFIASESNSFQYRHRISSVYNSNNLFYILKYACDGDLLTDGQKSTLNALKEELLFKYKYLYLANVSKDEIQLLLDNLNKNISPEQTKYNVSYSVYI